MPPILSIIPHPQNLYCTRYDESPLGICKPGVGQLLFQSLHWVCFFAELTLIWKASEYQVCSGLLSIDSISSWASRVPHHPESGDSSYVDVQSVGVIVRAHLQHSTLTGSLRTPPSDPIYSSALRNVNRCTLSSFSLVVTCFIKVAGGEGRCVHCSQ